MVEDPELSEDERRVRKLNIFLKTLCRVDKKGAGGEVLLRSGLRVQQNLRVDFISIGDTASFSGADADELIRILTLGAKKWRQEICRNDKSIDYKAERLQG